MKLEINKVFEWLSEDAIPRIERVLAYLPGGSIVTIDITDKKANPEIRPVKEIEEALAAETIRLLNQDPFSRKNLPEDDIREDFRDRRDKTWEMISPIVDNPPEVVFHKGRRWQLIKGQHESTGKPYKVIYESLRKFWRCGQVKNALLPDYRFSPSKDKRAGRKAGRELTAKDIESFELGIKAFYEKSEKPSLTDAYNKTMGRYFHVGVLIENGIPVPQMPPAHLLPTERQFRYWYDTRKDPQKSVEKREGKRFNLKHRSLEGSATSMGFGPGSLYQIDSTPADVNLISTINQAIIGRPVLYLVTDVFTRCIAGFHITLEDASYQEATLALENAFTDKLAFCKSFGIDIHESEWPCKGSPECLVADRGELKGVLANALVSAFRIRMDNCPPYRADMKAIVERFFRIGNQRLFHQLPGAIRKEKERGDKDARLEARLNIKQLTSLVIGWIFDHNRRLLDDYPADEFLMGSDTEHVPCSLWQWGMNAKTGALAVMDPLIVKTHLLQQGEASITPRGIHFRKAYYTCDTAIAEKWFLRPSASGTVKVAYDARDVREFYLRTKGTVEKCRLKQISEKYSSRTWAEVQAYFYAKGQAAKGKRSEEIQAEVKYQAQIASTVKEAENAFQPPTMPKTQRLRNVRDNRKKEAEHLRKGEQAAKPDQAPAYIGPPSKIGLLRRQKENKPCTENTSPEKS